VFIDYQKNPLQITSSHSGATTLMHDSPPFCTVLKYVFSCALTLGQQVCTMQHFML